ncbi:MAG: hypothetical protein ACRCY9_20650 [Phycicoccus sp.]
MAADEVTVEPDQLVSSARDSDHAAAQCTTGANVVDSVGIAPGAFGSVTHSGLISSMSEQFRSGVRTRLQESSDEASYRAAALRTAAADYLEMDANAAASYRRVLPEGFSPHGYQPYVTE